MKITKILIIVTSLALLSGCAKPPLKFHKNNTSKNGNTTAQTQSNNANNANTSIQTSLFASVSDAPTNSEINPLLAVSTFVFTGSVVTVGDAVNQVLFATGFQLAPHLSADVEDTLQQPLPVTNRKLGPMTIKNVLQVLMGDQVYKLQEDPLHRLVNFKIRSVMKPVLENSKNA